MTDPGLVRAACLFVPAAAAWGLWVVRRPNTRQAAAALLACAWNLPALVLLQWLAARWHWWHFEAEGGLFLGTPVDLLIGWVLLWGIVATLAAPRVPLWVVAGVCGWLDLLLMPVCTPVVRLDENWLGGEAVGLTLCLLPAQLLARWTWRDERLAWRVLLQVLCFSALLLGLLPAMILAQTGGSWAPLWGRPTWINSLLLQLLALPAILGLTAVQEFAGRGRGTPVPYDPPRQLVTSGVYRYLANPMQVSMVLLLAAWGFVLESPWVAAGGLMAIVYSAGLAAWDEGGSLHERYGEAWVRYRAEVRAWWPRLRPFVTSSSSARLYVAEGCDPCSELGRWIDGLQPRGLLRVAAEAHPGRDLTRLTYAPEDGSPEEEGIRALGRCLEHVHLGWAFVGWILRLPLISPFLQLLTDAAGGDPRRVTRPAS